MSYVIKIRHPGAIIRPFYFTGFKGVRVFTSTDIGHAQFFECLEEIGPSFRKLIRIGKIPTVLCVKKPYFRALPEERKLLAEMGMLWEFYPEAGSDPTRNFS